MTIVASILQSAKFLTVMIDESTAVISNQEQVVIGFWKSKRSGGEAVVKERGGMKNLPVGLHLYSGIHTDKLLVYAHAVMCDVLHQVIRNSSDITMVMIFVAPPPPPFLFFSYFSLCIEKKCN